MNKSLVQILLESTGITFWSNNPIEKPMTTGKRATTTTKAKKRKYVNKKRASKAKEQTTKETRTEGIKKNEAVSAEIQQKVAKGVKTRSQTESTITLKMKNLFNPSKNQEPNHKQHQQSLTKAMDSFSVNFELIEELTEHHKEDKHGWNDLTEVGKKLVELSKQLRLVTNHQMRKKVSNLISTYEVQNKKLLKSIAEVEAKRKESLPKSPPRIFRLNENDDLVEEPDKESNTAKDDEASVMSGIVTHEKKGGAKATESKTTTNETGPGSPKRKIQLSEEKTVGTESPNKQQKTDSANVWGTGNALKTSKQAKDPKKTDNPADKSQSKSDEIEQIRVRIQFQGEGKKTTTYQDQLRTLIYEIMQCVKAVDPSAALLPWKNGSNLKAINGNEARLLTKETLEQYIDIPVKVVNKFTSGRMYYRNGLRIKTKCNVLTFVDLWTNKKYEESETSPFQKWKSVKPAEMQNYDTSHCIGYFAGTVDRGEYSTIANQMRDEFGDAVEVSFQLIDQKEISSKVWQYAKEMAEKKHENIYSQEFKRHKFLYSPSALAVYVGKQSIVKTIKRKICQKYAQLKNNQWPIMRDGSRMRFIPILPGLVKNKRIKSNLYEHLLTQAISKANDTKYNLQLWDIHSPKKYLGNKTLERVIHEIHSEKNKNIPLFKHIARKWQKDPTHENWEVVVSPALEDEASAYLRKIRFKLRKKYGDSVAVHFKDPQSDVDYRPKYYAPETRSEDYDEEMEDFILNMGDVDPYMKVLIEGMNLVDKDKENESNLESLVINLPEEDLERIEKETQQAIETSNKKKGINQQQSNIENNSNRNESNVKEEGKSPPEVTQEEDSASSGEHTTWEEMSIVQEVDDVIPATPYEVKKIKGTIQGNSITTNEIETWKNKNWENYEKILEKVNRKEYEVMRILVQSILDTRAEKKDRETELEFLANLIGFTEENEKADQLKSLETIHEGNNNNEEDKMDVDEETNSKENKNGDRQSK